MESSAIESVAKAIFLRLNGNITVDSLAIPVYDEVPDGTPYPYITIGEFEVADYGVKVVGSDRVVPDIEAYSEYRGTKQIGGMLTAIATQLATADLDLSADGFEVFHQRKLSEEVRKAQDIDKTLVRQGIIKLEIIVSE